jgi:hypothetical protein
MDTWETFFREKSRRRAAVRDYRAVSRWCVIAVAFLALVIAAVVSLNSV